MDVGTVRRVDIDEKMRSAYLSYAMSVITSRALPDVRDGLKPVQRRILYAMYDMGLRHDVPTRKSARIVGEVLGKYHPHGDSAVYDAMVRMAQDFSMRYMLVDGQGNFGSIDGDSAAAIRYTEARLSAIGEELLADLDKNTVDFSDNFDGTLQEPQVLPARLPNLLVNGVGGIAVGMATNIPPHNLGEVVDAIAYLIDHYDRADDITVDHLMQFIKGPDFPTGGTILGVEGIRQAYATGKGRVVIRAQAHVEELRGGHSAIVVTELPYQVNKANLVERIADLVREGRVEGISDLRDESDRAGMRVVIEIKRGAEPGPILEQLIKLTQMQTTFGVNMLALVDGEPRTLSLKRVLIHYVDHRYHVLVRRTQYELDRARARAHILEGLLKALDMLDEVIDTIRRSQTVDTARTNLIKRFQFSELQAQAILDMQLRRLAALERRRLQDEYDELLKRIAYLEQLLASRAKLLGLIKEEALEMKATYGDPRRTRIAAVDDAGALRPEDLLPDEQVVALLTRNGQVVRYAAEAYAAQRSTLLDGLTTGAAGLQSMVVAHSQDTILFLTRGGQCYGVPAHQLPDGTQQEQGLSLGRLVHLAEGDGTVVALLATESFAEDRYLTMATTQGKIKRLALSELAGVGRNGLAAIGLSDGDALGWAALTSGQNEVVIVGRDGRAIRFAEDTVRPQGRTAGGMRGISLGDGEPVIGMDVVREDGELVVVTALGYAKRTSLEEYSTQGRGGQGSATVDLGRLGDTGPLVAAAVVRPDEEIVLCSGAGAGLRAQVRGIPARGRATWGGLVTRTRRNAIMPLEGNDTVAGLVRLDEVALPTPGAARPIEAPPRRRATRTAARPEAAPAEEEAAQPGAKPAPRRRATAAKAEEAPAEAEAQPKPAPRGRTTRAARPEAAPAEEEAAPPPARPAPRRRATASKVEAAPAEAEAQPKPATRGRTTRAARPEAAPAEEEAAQPAARPAPRRRATRARAADSEDSAAGEQSAEAGQSADGGQPADEPPAESAPRRARRATSTVPPRRTRK